MDELIASLWRKRAFWILLLACWVPVSFFVFYFAKKRARLIPMPLVFDAGEPFVPHVAVDLMPSREEHGGKPLLMGKEYRAIFVVGTQGFTARFTLPPAGGLEAAALRVAAQFLRPDVAMPHFAAGSAFTVIEGRHTVATGEVAKVLFAV